MAPSIGAGHWARGIGVGPAASALALWREAATGLEAPADAAASAAALWVGTSLGGMWAAMQRRFELHRLLMRLSYAMTFAAVTLRLQIPIGYMLGYSGYPAMSVWLAYSSWIPNVLAVLAYSGLRHLQEQKSDVLPCQRRPKHSASM